MRLLALVFAAGFLCLASGFAQDLFPAFVTGNRLLEICTPVQTPPCYAYVEGVADAFQSTTFSALRMQQNALFCLPQGVTSRQLIDIAINYLRDHPEQRHDVASANVALAFANAFPCPK